MSGAIIYQVMGKSVLCLSAELRNLHFTIIMLITSKHFNQTWKRSIEATNYICKILKYRINTQLHLNHKQKFRSNYLLWFESLQSDSRGSHIWLKRAYPFFFLVGLYFKINNYLSRWFLHLCVCCNLKNKASVKHKYYTPLS